MPPRPLKRYKCFREAPAAYCHLDTHTNCSRGTGAIPLESTLRTFCYRTGDKTAGRKGRRAPSYIAAGCVIRQEEPPLGRLVPVAETKLRSHFSCIGVHGTYRNYRCGLMSDACRWRLTPRSADGVGERKKYGSCSSQHPNKIARNFFSI